MLLLFHFLRWYVSIWTVPSISLRGFTVFPFDFIFSPPNEPSLKAFDFNANNPWPIGTRHTRRNSGQVCSVGDGIRFNNTLSLPLFCLSLSVRRKRKLDNRHWHWASLRPTAYRQRWCVGVLLSFRLASHSSSDACTLHHAHHCTTPLTCWCILTSDLLLFPTHCDTNPSVFSSIDFSFFCSTLFLSVDIDTLEHTRPILF